VRDVRNVRDARLNNRLKCEMRNEQYLHGHILQISFSLDINLSKI